jgi:RNA polymerase sigma-70 factor, ECF subfamily
MGSFVTERRAISATRDDIATYDRLFEATRERLVRICVGLVGADAADDVVQDTYLRARDRFSQLRDANLFDGWVTRIAINLCLNRHRSRRRLRALLPLIGRSEPRPADVGLRELIEQLPHRERAVVVLHYGYGYSLEEIARIGAITPVNARTIVHRARRRLASQLKDADR